MKTTFNDFFNAYRNMNVKDLHLREDVIPHVTSVHFRHMARA